MNNMCAHGLATTTRHHPSSYINLSNPLFSLQIPFFTPLFSPGSLTWSMSEYSSHSQTALLGNQALALSLPLSPHDEGRIASLCTSM